jgi:hypothetical protein
MWINLVLSTQLVGIVRRDEEEHTREVIITETDEIKRGIIVLLSSLRLAEWRQGSECDQQTDDLFPERETTPP